ncbi:cobaltochelatase subunit CobN [Methanopyrus kandleri]|uniref:Cobaltochelatase subunit CobN n=1 Tax=Methanopyrus kandleri TaxID=2320 RepID=A0A832SVM1_9EURY|nr:cobaltochelatase subunit CobN [Methanopyrus kandleri]HII71007.1 cobaltochelatase subunit CobN [Methanopyrus kandleri]
MAPVLILVMVFLAVSVPAHSLDIVIFGNAAKGSPEEIRAVEERVKEDLGVDVRIHVHNVLVSWSDQSAPVDFDSLAHDIERSEIVALDNMGPMPTPFAMELSERVLGKPASSMQEFLRELAERKRIVAYVTGDQHDFVILGSGCRRIVDGTAAVVNLGFLFRFSSDLTPVIEFLVWLADPSVPAERLHLSDVRISSAAVYVPGRGWEFPEVSGEALEMSYHRWLHALEGRDRTTEPLWTKVRLSSIPSWVKAIREASSQFFRSLWLPNRRVVVVLDYIDALYKGERDLVEKLTDTVYREVSREFQDVTAIAVLCDGNMVSPIEALLGLKDAGYDIAAVVSLWAFTLDYPKPGTWALEGIDAPIIKAVYPFWANWMDEPQRYLNMNEGDPESGRVGALFEWGYQVIGGPEPEGAFWFKMIALKERDQMMVFPLEDMIEDVARMVAGFLRLRYLPESEKRVAFVLYCYPPGRGEIGASYLDVFRSLVRIFEALAERGYDLGPATSLYRKLAELRREDPKAAEEMEKRLAHALMAASDLVLKNVGPWAKGELAGMVRLYRGGRAEVSVDWNGKSMKVIVDHGVLRWIDVDGSSYVLGTVSEDQLVPVEALERWYREDVVRRFEYYLSLLTGDDPETERARKSLMEWMRAIEEKFGPPTDNRGIMRYGLYYVIPALRLGNVVVMLQPVRGWSGSPELVYHSPDLPPQWQYVAAYEWLRRVFRADAVVHVGTHGTLEWLPGHQVGLLGVDWPHVLLPDVPHVYLYIVSNPGEAMVAKYRSGPILLTHLSPPWGYFKDLGKYGELERELTRYFQMKSFGGDPHVLEELRRRIVETAERLGLLKDVVNMIFAERKEPPPENPKEWAMDHIEEFIDKLHDFLLDLALRNVAYGLHVYGEDVDEDVAVEQAAALASSRVAPVFAYYAGLIDSPDQEALNRLQSDRPDIFAWFKRELRECLRDILRTVLKYPDLTSQLERYVELKDREEYYGEPPDGVEGPGREAKRLFWQVSDRLTILAQEAILRYFHGRRNDPDHEHLLAEAVADLYRIYVHYRDSGRTELEELLAALDGRFVPPGLLGEPMWNTKVLPTGRDGYPIDPSQMPTPEAWDVARKLVDQMLADYYLRHGRWPEAVGVVLWGIHELCTGGLGIAEVLYLLGVRPVWNPDTGQVTGVELIPLDELKVKVGNRWINRPRIDVVVWAALHMEDPLKLLTEAYYLVSHVDEPTDVNYRRKHYLELKPRLVKELEKSGMSPEDAEKEADVIASSGFFAQPPGVYAGTGACDIVEHAWTDVSGTVGLFEDPETALKNFEQRFWEKFRITCESRMAYVYTAEARILTIREGNKVRVVVLRTSTDRVYHAIPSVEAFRYLMSKVDVVVHSVVNTWGLIDTDDFYDWVGGMALYATHAAGHAPEVYIGNAVDPTAARTLTGYQQLVGEVYTKLLSESWWKAMLEHGDYGWSRIVRRIEFLAGWGITVPSLRPYLNSVYTEVFKAVVQWISQAPPRTEYGWAAVVSTIAWFVELARTGVWKPDSKTLAQAAKVLLETMAKHGPATCHHTSPNPALVVYAARVLLEAGYSYSEVKRLLSKVMKWYAKLDNPEIVREIERLTNLVMTRAASERSARAATASRSAATSSSAYTGVTVSRTVSSFTGPGLPGGRGSAQVVVGLLGSVLRGVARGTVLPEIGYWTGPSRYTGHAKAGSRVGKTERSTERESKATQTFTRTSPPSSAPKMIWEWVAALLLTLLFLLVWRIRPTGPRPRATWVTPATVPPVAA